MVGCYLAATLKFLLEFDKQVFLMKSSPYSFIRLTLFHSSIIKAKKSLNSTFLPYSKSELLSGIDYVSPHITTVIEAQIKKVGHLTRKSVQTLAVGVRSTTVLENLVNGVWQLPFTPLWLLYRT